MNTFTGSESISEKVMLFRPGVDRAPTPSPSSGRVDRLFRNSRLRPIATDRTLARDPAASKHHAVHCPARIENEENYTTDAGSGRRSRKRLSRDSATAAEQQTSRCRP